MEQVLSSSPQAVHALVNAPRDGSRFSREAKRSILRDFSRTGTRLKEQPKRCAGSSRPHLAWPALTSGSVPSRHGWPGPKGSQGDSAFGDDDDQGQTGWCSDFYVFTCAPTMSIAAAKRRLGDAPQRTVHRQQKLWCPGLIATLADCTGRRQTLRRQAWMMTHDRLLPLYPHGRRAIPRQGRLN